jgi:hypothetical protein
MRAWLDILKERHPELAWIIAGHAVASADAFDQTKKFAA